MKKSLSLEFAPEDSGKDVVTLDDILLYVGKYLN